MTTPLRPATLIPVIDVATRRSCTVEVETDAWRALLEWVKAHGLDPNDILANTGVARDADACCIRYTGFVRNDQGQRILDRDTIRHDGTVDDGVAARFKHFDGIEQGEAPPLPFPDIIERLLEAAA